MTNRFKVVDEVVVLLVAQPFGTLEKFGRPSCPSIGRPMTGESHLEGQIVYRGFSLEDDCGVIH